MRPEFRKKKRRYISHGARIVLANGSLLENCRIIDISGTGARLEIKNSKPCRTNSSYCFRTMAACVVNARLSGDRRRQSA